MPEGSGNHAESAQQENIHWPLVLDVPNAGVESLAGTPPRSTVPAQDFLQVSPISSCGGGDEVHCKTPKWPEHGPGDEAGANFVKPGPSCQGVVGSVMGADQPEGVENSGQYRPTYKTEGSFSHPGQSH